MKFHHYLESSIEELAVLWEASIDLLLRAEPRNTILDFFIINKNIFLGSAKRSHYKSC
jgi:hypothetical protein